MAKIRDEYILDTSEAVDGLTKMSQRLVALADKVEQTQAAYQRIADSSALDMAVEKLEVYQQAARNALTDSQRDAAIDQLERQMTRLGVVWSNAEAEIASSDILMRTSLRQLAAQGDITTTSIAQSAYSKQKDAAAAQMAAAQNKYLAQAEKEAAREAEGAEKSASLLQRALMRFQDVHSPLDGVVKRLGRMALSMFTVRRLIRYMSDAIARAPDEIGEKWTSLTNNIKNGFAGVMVSLLRGLENGLDRLNAAFQSEAGQKFLAGLEKLAFSAGEAIGKLLGVAASLVEWLGNNFEVVITAAGIAIAFYAAKMLLAAGATALAHGKLILIAAAIAFVISAITKLTGSTASAADIIAGILGTLYFLIYNGVADLYNLIATFAEFFANVFNDPVAAIAHLFFDLFDVIVGIVEDAASIIDALLGSNISGAVAGFRNKVKDWVNEQVGENSITIQRMEKIALGDAIGQTKDFLGGFSGGALSQYTLQDIKEDTGSIAGAMKTTDAELAELIDLAERQYVAQVNLTTQTPVINVSGQNTGNTKEDREALADIIDLVLRESIATGTTRSYSNAFSGG